MTNYICINGNKTELTEEQIKQLGFEVKKESPFKRVRNEMYFCIDSQGNICNIKDYGSFDDNNRYNVANYCTDESIMKQRALHETLNRLLWRYSMEHDGDKIDWGGVRAKYKIAYSCDDHLFFPDGNTVIHVIGAPYFNTKEIAQNAIKEIIEPFMKEHPEFKW